MNPINPVCRPATENEINYGEAKWCAKCTRECDSKGKDELVMCDYFKTNDKVIVSEIIECDDSVADIVSNMRDYADRTEKQGLYDLRECGTEYLRALADRIEAAARREREAGAEAAQVCGEIGEMIGREATREKSSLVGNAAKMREALSDACYAMFNFLKTQNGGYEEMAKALDKAKAALAEPPRNCDRPECATAKAAQDVWRKEDGGKTAFYEWILATSTKGGAK